MVSQSGSRQVLVASSAMSGSGGSSRPPAEAEALMPGRVQDGRHQQGHDPGGPGQHLVVAEQVQAVPAVHVQWAASKDSDGLCPRIASIRGVDMPSNAARTDRYDPSRCRSGVARTAASSSAYWSWPPVAADHLLGSLVQRVVHPPQQVRRSQSARPAACSRARTTRRPSAAKSACGSGPSPRSVRTAVRASAMSGSSQPWIGVHRSAGNIPPDRPSGSKVAQSPAVGGGLPGVPQDVGLGAGHDLPVVPVQHRRDDHRHRLAGPGQAAGDRGSLDGPVDGLLGDDRAAQVSAELFGCQIPRVGAGRQLRSHRRGLVAQTLGGQPLLPARWWPSPAPTGVAGPARPRPRPRRRSTHRWPG